jgi:MFS family permease
MIADTQSLLADHLLSVALPLYLLDRTGEPSIAAVAALVRVLPVALLGAVGGSLADRAEHRRLLIRTAAVRALLVLPMLLVTHEVLPLHVMLAVLLALSLVAQVTGPAAGASLPMIVSLDDLPSVNAKLAARSIVLQLTGPTVGAVLYAHLGLDAVVLVNATLYLTASASWRMLPARQPLPAASRGVLRDALEGVRAVRQDPLLRRLLGAIALALVGLSLELAVLVPFLRQDLHASPTGVAVLTSLEAVGGLLAAALLPSLQRRLGVRSLLRIGMVGLPIAALGFLLSRTALHAVPGVVAAGLLLTLLTTALQVHLQRSVPAGFLGRVLGLLGSVLGISAVIGSALAVPLSSLLSLRQVLLVAVTLETAGVVVFAARPIAPESTTP